MSSMESLFWDASFAIASSLRRAYPAVDLSQTSLNQLYEWVIALPNFADDPDLVNDELLLAIYQDWFEETS